MITKNPSVEDKISDQRKGGKGSVGRTNGTKMFIRKPKTHTESEGIKVWGSHLNKNEGKISTREEKRERRLELDEEKGSRKLWPGTNGKKRGAKGVWNDGPCGEQERGASTT